MEEVNKLLKTAVDDIERLLNSKTVVGDPITVEGATIIPLVSIGFGFGAGGGSNKSKSKVGDNVAGGTGAGGGVKPVAVIIISEEGVRLQTLKGSSINLLEKVVDTVGKTVAGRREKSSDNEEE